MLILLLQILLSWSEQAWSLHEVLGPNLEALDPIRMDCFCHIKYFTFDPDVEGPCFEMLGNELKHLRIAASRLDGIIHQQNAHRLSRPRWYVVKPCEEPLQEIIRFQQYSVAGITGNDSIKLGSETLKCMVPRMDGKLLDPQQIEDREHMPEMVMTDRVVTGKTGIRDVISRQLEAVTMTTLTTLNYYRGFLQMRASLGTFVFTKYFQVKKQPKLKYNLDEFDSMLSDTNQEEIQVEGHITKESDHPSKIWTVN